MVKPHIGNLKEIDFFRQNLSREEYLNEIMKRSETMKEFEYNGKIIAVAGAMVKERGWCGYWQFLTEDFPDRIPRQFINEFVEYAEGVNRKYGKLLVTIFDENVFAKWLVSYGRKKRDWKCDEIASFDNPDRKVYFWYKEAE